MSETSARSVDCLVIGAGIAGASIAANLAPHMTVAVLEAEAHAGYHTTGRSAALYSALYGNAPVRALTRASRPFFDSPTAGFAEVPLLRARDTLYLIGTGQQGVAERFAADEDVRTQTRRLGADEVIRRLAILQRDRIEGALLDDTSADIDVDALHQGFLRQARAGGVRLHLGSPLRELVREKKGWLARTDSFSLRAPLVINAAGAWADAVADLAGVAPLALQPLRRTAALIDVPAGVAAAEAADWPAVIAIDESHYFKPDAGLLGHCVRPGAGRVDHQRRAHAEAVGAGEPALLLPHQLAQRRAEVQPHATGPGLAKVALMQRVDIDVRRRVVEQRALDPVALKDGQAPDHLVRIQPERLCAHVLIRGEPVGDGLLPGADQIKRVTRPQQRHLGEARRRSIEERPAGPRQRPDRRVAVERRIERRGAPGRVVPGVRFRFEHGHRHVRRKVRRDRRPGDAGPDHQAIHAAGGRLTHGF